VGGVSAIVHSRRASANATPSRNGVRIARLLDILLLAGSGPGWTAARLAAHFGVSRRRIFQDIRLLDSAGIRLVAVRGGYTPLNAALQLPVTLTAREALALLGPDGAGGALRRSARAKLAACLPPPFRRLFHQPARVSDACAGQPPCGLVCERIERAMAEDRRIRLHYQGIRDAAARDREVEPHALFLRGGAWYLAARVINEPLEDARSESTSCEKGWRLFRLDRIESVEVLADRFVPCEGFDVGQYLGQGVGTWKGERLDARVEVLPSHVTSIRSEAHARGLTFREEGGKGLLEIPHGSVDATAWWLAQFGEGVRVREPEALRERMAALGRRIAELNGRKPAGSAGRCGQAPATFRAKTAERASRARRSAKADPG
jgi:predicted DNA-binding transcriptional regulator YafY